MATADVLSGGPSPRRPRPRWLPVAGIALVVLLAVVLAARVTAGRPQAAATTPPAPTSAVRPGAAPGVVAVAIGARWAYALVADCDPGAARACAYRLHRRSLGGGAWTALPLLTETRASVGPGPVLAVTGDEVATVLEPAGGQVYSTADGAAATRHPLAPGPPIDAVPADGLVDSAYCGACQQVTVLEPVTGRLRPLRQQPFRDGRLRSYTLRGDVLWAVSATADGVTSARSADRGRTWTVLPVRGLASGIDALQLVTGPTGPAYLLSATTGTDGTSRLVGVWSTQAAAGAWERLPGPIPRSARSALAADRGLLVTDAGGTVWRLQPTGGFAALPDPGPARPELVATGPGRMLAATLRGRVPDRLVLTSYDEGESWRVEKVN
ncbi:MAG TPA: hypothetical protein VLM05_03255 [Mycobacteriales bacterium]|nr:hypothetical protein [Mycobacteriales bacterium]